MYLVGAVGTVPKWIFIFGKMKLMIVQLILLVLNSAVRICFFESFIQRNLKITHALDIGQMRWKCVHWKCPDESIWETWNKYNLIFNFCGYCFISSNTNQLTRKKRFRRYKCDFQIQKSPCRHLAEVFKAVATMNLKIRLSIRKKSPNSSFHYWHKDSNVTSTESDLVLKLYGFKDFKNGKNFKYRGCQTYIRIGFKLSDGF